MSVHGGHCCIVHGCKYGDPACPIALGTERQAYICEYCDDDKIYTVEEAIRLKDFFKSPKEEFLLVLKALEELFDGPGLSYDSISIINKYIPSRNTGKVTKIYEGDMPGG